MTTQRPGRGDLPGRGAASAPDVLEAWAGNPASRWDRGEEENAEPRLTFLVLMRLTNKGRRVMRYAPQKMFEINHEVEQHGCEIVGQWSLLGPWDFATVIVAKDNGTIHTMVQALAARGDLKTMTLPALPSDEFVAAMKRDLGGER